MLQEKLDDILDTDVAREHKYQKMMKRFEEVRMGSGSRSGCSGSGSGSGLGCIRTKRALDPDLASP